MKGPQTVNSKDSSAICSDCGAELDSASRTCPACGRDVGCPNVRRASAEAETEALSARVANARHVATSCGYVSKLNSFIRVVSSKSGVVVAAPPAVARQLLTSSQTLYTTYEKMVAGQFRSAAPSSNDCNRGVVAKALFGSFDHEIRYGSLSLDGIGLTSYGSVHLLLRDIAIGYRTSLLECNSYSFVERNPVGPGSPLPLGYVSTWDQRGELAGAKLASQIVQQTKEDDFPRLLLVQKGNRHTDDFVEAHIYGGFNRSAIKAVRIVEGTRLDRKDKIDLVIVRELAKDLGILEDRQL